MQEIIPIKKWSPNKPAFKKRCFDNMQTLRKRIQSFQKIGNIQQSTAQKIA